MVSAALDVRPSPTSSFSLRPARLLARLRTAVSTRSSRSPVRALDEWLEQDRGDGARCAVRQHPHYQVKFSRLVRGQRLGCFVDYFAATDFFSLCCYLPLEYAPERRVALLDLINRLNFENFYGSLEMDPEDGCVRYRHAFDAESLRLSPAYLDLIVSHAEQVCDHHLPALMALVMRDEPVETLLQRVGG